jgi:hypothetical protein
MILGFQNIAMWEIDVFVEIVVVLANVDLNLKVQIRILFNVFYNIKLLKSFPDSISMRGKLRPFCLLLLFALFAVLDIGPWNMGHGP